MQVVNPDAIIPATQVVKNVTVPVEVVTRVEHKQHIVQPIHIVEEPVVHQVVSMNRRTVQGTPYVAGITSSSVFVFVNIRVGQGPAFAKK